MESVIDFLERSLGVAITRFLRWLLFLPLSLVYGAVFLIVVGAAANSAGRYFSADDVLLGALLMGIIAAVCAGYGTVQIAVAIAPGFSRVVAGITWCACMFIAVLLIWWARRSSDVSFLISAWVTAILYSLSSSVAAIVFVLRGKRQDGL